MDEKGRVRRIGARKIEDNISDFKAQLAANQKGVALIQSFIAEKGIAYVQAYMGFIQKNAAQEVSAMLGELGEEFGVSTGEVKEVAHESEFMDDGSEVSLALTIDRRSEETQAVLDFRGTSLQTLGNWNAPRVIVKSAVIYALRCMLKSEIPLNQGCLEPITILTKRGSLIDPREDAAVVGGNVLTS